MDQSSATPKKSWKKFVGLLALFVGLPVLLFGVAPGVLSDWDDSHRVRVDCTVERAAPTTSSSRSLRGIGSTGVQIVVETSDCGDLLVREGVDRDTADVVAADLRPGRTYTFEVGQTAWALRGVTAFTNISPEAYDYTAPR